MDEAEVVAAVPIVELEEFPEVAVVEEPVVEAVVDVEVEAVEPQGNILTIKSAILYTYAPKVLLKSHKKWNGEILGK